MRDRHAPDLTVLTWTLRVASATGLLALVGRGLESGTGALLLASGALGVAALAGVRHLRPTA